MQGEQHCIRLVIGERCYPVAASSEGLGVCRYESIRAMFRADAEKRPQGARKKSPGSKTHRMGTG